MALQKDKLDFIVIGAQKSGTTSLYLYLRRHPEVCLPAGKEAPYFSHDAAVRSTGWSAYMQNMVTREYGGVADPAHKWGTVTPQYMAGGVFEADGERERGRAYDERTVPMRIHERLPDVRLVAILRDPIARALSHYRMSARRGYERRSFDDAIDDLLRPRAAEDARRHPRESSGYIAWGEYARILGGYLEVFPRERMLILFTDELEHAPSRLLARIHEFIGVRADFEPENVGQRFHAGFGGRSFSWKSPASWRTPSSPVSPQGMVRAARRSSAVRAAWHALPEDPRQELARRYKRAARRAVLRDKRVAAADAGREAEPRPATLERLREHYALEADQLVTLLGQAPPWQSPAGLP